MKSLCNVLCALSVSTVLFSQPCLSQTHDQVELIIEMRGDSGDRYTADDFINRLENQYYQILDVAGPLPRFLGQKRTLYALTIQSQYNLNRVINHIAAQFPDFRISEQGRDWSGEMNQKARLSFLDAIGLSGQTDAIGLSGQTDSTLCAGETFYLSDNLGNPDLFDPTTLTWTNASLPVLADVAALSPSGDPFEALFQQRHVTDIGADRAWPTTAGQGVVVAVLDTGMDVDHPFLRNAVARNENGRIIGANFVRDGANRRDPRERPLPGQSEGVGYGHGTHVSGIIRTIAPNVTILPVRVADSTGRGSLFALLCGFDYALKRDADVINLSMSFDNDSSYLRELLAAANRKNVLVVTSAGNNNNGDMTFPANYARTLVVGSVGEDLYKSCFGNFGAEVDVVAYGEGVLSAHPGGGYAFRYGTSMAAPIAAGQAALMRQLRPNTSANQIHRRISRTGDALPDPLFENGQLGDGLLNVPAALNLD